MVFGGASASRLQYPLLIPRTRSRDAERLHFGPWSLFQRCGSEQAARARRRKFRASCFLSRRFKFVRRKLVKR